MPARGKATYSTAMPCRLYSAISLWNLRQKPQLMSVNTVTRCFGFAGA